MKSAIFTALTFLIHHSALACVGCRQPGVGGPDEPQTVLAGVAFSWSVVTMLAFVALIVSFLAFYIVKTCRRVDRENAQR